jgi:hypothetical protein
MREIYVFSARFVHIGRCNYATKKGSHVDLLFITALQIHWATRQRGTNLLLKEYDLFAYLATKFYDKATYDADFHISNHTTVAVQIYAYFSIISPVKQ